ncbi:MAG: AAA family ATPase [Clostridia bacterium]|nr:AAA family ATPase [Clostridia bacterium]
MGVYVNPGNRAFAEIADKDYVDKTGLIGLINQTIGTKSKLTCISRPRRFGKTWIARMLAAYYDRTCDSRSLFDQKEHCPHKDISDLSEPVQRGFPGYIWFHLQCQGRPGIIPGCSRDD